jgi:hypothetical protein
MSCISQLPRAQPAGSRAGGRRDRAPSPRGAALDLLGAWSHGHAVAARRRARGGGALDAPSISTRHSRHEPNALSESVAHSLGIVDARQRGRAQHRRAPGTHDLAPSMVTVSVASPPRPRGCRGRARARGGSRPGSWGISRSPSGEVRSARCAPASASGRPWRTASPSSIVSQRSSAGQVGLASCARPARIRSISLDAALRADRDTGCTCRTTPWRRTPSRNGPSEHVDGVVEDHDAAVAEHATGLGQAS